MFLKKKRAPGPGGGLTTQGDHLHVDMITNTDLEVTRREDEA
jgi:hypothetical protein